MEIDNILEHEREKHERLDSLLNYISFGIGSIIFVIFFAVVLALVFWFLSPQTGTVVAEPHIVLLDEFVEALEATENPEIFDMRSEKDYSASHIPRAEMVKTDKCHTFGIDVCSRKSSCDSTTTAFYYSVKGEDYHEVRYALSVSKSSCWSEVYLLEGGFVAWNSSGLETE